MTLLLLISAIASFVLRGTSIPARRLILPLALAAFSALYVGWPALIYGFGWEGFANSDMSTYCLGATRFLNHGFYEVPTVDELEGLDYSQLMWFHYGPGMFRCGSDLLLSWVAALSKLHPWEIAMPTIISLALCQLWAAGAFVVQYSKERWHGYLTMSLLAISPFFHHGTLVQVIGQVGGIAMLIAFCTFSMTSIELHRSHVNNLLKRILVLSLIGSSLCIFYPEVIPFAIVAIGLYHLLAIVKGDEKLGHVTIAVLVATVGFVICARLSLVTAVGTILFSLGHSLARPHIGYSVFDAALLPSSPAVLFGLQSFYNWPYEPVQSILIILGFVLLVLTLVCCLKSLRQHSPYAYLCFSMMMLGIKLFFASSSFGLFKLGMYVQPVLMAALSKSLKSFPKRWAITVCCAYSLVSSVAMADYWLQTTRNPNIVPVGPFEAKGPLSKLEKPKLQPNCYLAGSNPSVVNDNILASLMVGIPMKIMGREAYFVDIEKGVIAARLLRLPPAVRPLRSQISLAQSLSSRIRELRLQSSSNVFGASFIDTASVVEGSQMDLVSLKWQRFPYFNKENPQKESRSVDYFQFVTAHSLRNYLIFQVSSRGGNFYDFGTDTAYWQMEADPMVARGMMFAIGRFLLFRVLSPSESVRLSLNLTKSICGQGRSLLPAAAVAIGETEVPLSLVGHGAAHVFSGPFEPKKARGNAFVAVDLKEEGKMFPIDRKGLMTLYGTSIPVDTRELVAFARDISLMSEDEYQMLERPQKVDFVSRDFVKNPKFEFSGVSEDGWVSSECRLVLGKVRSGERVVITGTVPAIAQLALGGNELEVVVGGDHILSTHLQPGSFTLSPAISKDRQTTEILLRFKQSANLPGGDNRPVAAQLHRCEIMRTGDTERKKCNPPG
jgi:hypothetical protein